MATKKKLIQCDDIMEAKINLMYARAAGLVKPNDPKYKKIFDEMDAMAAQKKTTSKKKTVKK